MSAPVDLALSRSAYQGALIDLARVPDRLVRAPVDLTRYQNTPPNLGQPPTLSLSWNLILSHYVDNKTLSGAVR